MSEEPKVLHEEEELSKEEVIKRNTKIIQRNKEEIFEKQFSIGHLDRMITTGFDLQAKVSKRVANQNRARETGRVVLLERENTKLTKEMEDQ